MWSKKKADTSVRGLPFYVRRNTFSKINKKQRIQYMLSVLFVVGMLCIIFRFSAADATHSSHLSEGICIRLVREVNTIFPKQFSGERMIIIAEIIEYPVRKCAHFTEYAMLGIVVNNYLWNCFFIERQGKKQKITSWSFILRAELFCIFYACSDELHQYFVPGRSCRFFDVCVDSTGAFCGALLFWALSRRKRQEIYKRKEY